MTNRNEVVKRMIVSGLFVSIITIIDIRGLNLLKITKKYSILQKLLIIQAMNLPFYYYFYNSINKVYTDLKYHLVYKYLVKDGKKNFDGPTRSQYIQHDDSFP